MGNILKHWIPLAVIICCLSGLTYLAVQQDLRLNANDPQIQLSQDNAALLSTGTNPRDILSPQVVQMATSLTPFTIVYDSKGAVVASNAVLNNKVPQLPDGVLQYAADHGENRFTWQPAIGVRSAVVVTKYTNGFVLVGRSLTEVEKREDQLLLNVLLGLIATLFISFFFTGVFLQKRK